MSILKTPLTRRTILKTSAIGAGVLAAPAIISSGALASSGEINFTGWAGYPGIVGLPATAIPLGLSPEGLPVGAQVIAPAFADPLGLRFARFVEDGLRRFVPPPGF